MCKGPGARGSMVRTLTCTQEEKMWLATGEGTGRGGGKERAGRGEGGTGGQEPNHSGFVGLSAKLGALSLSRDQGESVEGSAEQGQACPYLQICLRLHGECAWGRDGCSRVHFRQTCQENMPWSRGRSGHGIMVLVKKSGPHARG